MSVVLTITFLTSIIALTSLFVFQYYRIKRGTVSELDRTFHDPLSEKQLENVKVVVTGQIKEHGRIITIILLKLTIQGKKLMKRQFDRAIIKLSKMAFPKDNMNIEIQPNRFLEVAREESDEDNSNS